MIANLNKGVRIPTDNEALETCEMCERPILMMHRQSEGLCSQICEKYSNGEITLEEFDQLWKDMRVK